MLNAFQKTLFDNLMTICSVPESAFYYVDQTWLSDSFRFRIFLYRLASYTDFQKDGALECRGHTYRIDANGNPLELVSMPMQKFFNLDENPFVMNLDLTDVDRIVDKLDGSLISTVKVDDQFILKSKGSLNSTQAQDATRLLNTAEYARLKEYCHILATTGHTVNMEYMAPDNRIVIGYAKPTLKVLNVRNNANGDYLDPHESFLPKEFICDEHPIPEDPHSWAYSVADMTDDIEGYIVKLRNGTWFKLKTDKYKALHHTKDSITVPRRLFEACVSGGADDLRSMFATDALACAAIDDMMEKVSKIYNHLDAYINAFYEKHKDSDRKTYALAGQADETLMKDGTFSLAMNLYIGRPANVAEFMVKNYKKYGIKDEADLPPEALE